MRKMRVCMPRNVCMILLCTVFLCLIIKRVVSVCVCAITHTFPHFFYNCARDFTATLHNSTMMPCFSTRRGRLWWCGQLSPARVSISGNKMVHGIIARCDRSTITASLTPYRVLLYPSRQDTARESCTRTLDY